MKATMRRAVFAALLTMGAVSSAVQPAAASCTDTYEDCIDAARGKAWVFRQMEYIECFAEWAGCVKDYLE